MRLLPLLSSAALLLPALAAARPAELDARDQTVLASSTDFVDLADDYGVAGLRWEGDIPGTGHLSEWSRQNKEDFLDALRNNSANDWIVVIGNEAGDADSLVSALALSYMYTHLPEPQKAVALLQTEEDALDLRPENALMLHLAHMAPRHRDLLTIDELPIKPEEMGHRIKGVALVDHNIPLSAWDGAKVVAIIDHHEDRGIANDTADPRMVERSGSCTSLVTRYIFEQLPDAEGIALSRNDASAIDGVDAHMHGPLPTELVDLLLRVIAVDTSGLSRDARQLVDKESAQRLFARSSFTNSTLKATMKALDQEMSLSRKALGTLDVRNLLRRDWKGDAINTKSKKYPQISLGFASAPVSLEEQIKRTPEGTTPEWFAIERAWTAEIQADVSVALTNFRDPKSGEKYRQLALVVAHGYGKRLHEGSGNRLFQTIVKAIEEPGIPGMKKWKRPDGKKLLPRRAVYQFQSDTASRKHWRPIIEKAVMEWEG
ncbi:hypothetical protein JCM10449v2_005836 [Rhodotorula kratochvilovae]